MTLSRTVYLDWAATSWPKPPCVGDAMVRALSTCGSPGRSGHSLSIEASRVLADARMAIADFFEVPEPDHVAFTKNITEALNVALLGLLRKGDHVVTTSIEHNSVMRPLRHLEKAGIHIHVVVCTPLSSMWTTRARRQFANTKFGSALEFGTPSRRYRMSHSTARWILRTALG